MSVWDDDMANLKAKLDALLPKWEKAKEKFDELDAARIDLERDIEALRIQAENEAWENGTYHDQMAVGFSIRTHGRNKRFVGERSHRVTYDDCRCEVQCPVCKRYTVGVSYRKDRATGEMFDVKWLSPFIDDNGYVLCEECGGSE